MLLKLTFYTIYVQVRKAESDNMCYARMLDGQILIIEGEYYKKKKKYLKSYKTIKSY